MDTMRMVGTALAAVSFVFMMLARLQLGKSFAVGTVAKELVTHGLYSRIRHPLYIFVDLTIVGIALAVARWYVTFPLLGLVVLVLAPLQIVKAGREERVLREKFGKRYDEYREHTWC